MFQKSESIFVFARVGICDKTQKQNVCSAKFSMVWRNPWRSKSNNSKNQFYWSIVQLILLFSKVSNCIWDWREANHAC